MKKRLLLSLLTLALTFTLTACTVQNNPKPDNPSSTPAQSETQSTPVDTTPSVPQDTTTPSTPQGNTAQNKTSVTAEQAKDIALKHANLTSDKITHYKSELDFDDGVKHYDIEFKANGYEYDYEVQADNGKILKSEKEFDD